MLPMQFRFIWQSGFRGGILEINEPEAKNCLWRPCLLTDWDEMNNLFRGCSIDASYQLASFDSFGPAEIC